jgi:hypothetical protein
VLSTAQSNQRLILLELSELCPQLVDGFIDELATHATLRPEALPLTHIRGKLGQALAFEV